MTVYIVILHPKFADNAVIHRIFDTQERAESYIKLYSKNDSEAFYIVSRDVE